MGKKASARARLSGQDLDEFTNLRLDPKYCITTRFRVPHRDVRGKMVDMEEANWRLAQKTVLREIEAIRALEIIHCLRTEKLFGVASEILRFRRIDFEKATYAERVDAITALGVDRFLDALFRRVPAAQESVIDGFDLTILKARRLGISVAIQLYLAHRCMFTPNFEALVLAHERPAARKVAMVTKGVHRHWRIAAEDSLADDDVAFRLRPVVERLSDDRIEWEHGSALVVQTAGGGESSRSWGFGAMHLSEYAWYEDPAAVAAGIAGAPKHSWKIKESTANGPTGPFKEDFDAGLSVWDVIEAYDQGNHELLGTWTGKYRHFLSWLDDPGYAVPMSYPEEAQHIRETLDDYERALIERFPNVTVEQLKFRRRKIATVRPKEGMTPEAFFQQEFPATPDEAFQGVGSRVFDPRYLVPMQNRAHARKPIGFWVLTDRRPPEKVLRHLANFTMHEPPEHGAKYVMGLDPAQGLKRGDWSAGVLLHRMDGIFAREVCSFRGKPDPRALGDIAVLICELYNDAYLLPEEMGPGHSTCARIAELRYPHVYRRATTAADAIDIDPGDDTKLRNGIHMSSTLKSRIIYDMQGALGDGLIELRTLAFIEELFAFECISEGTRSQPRLEAPAGKHDDYVMAGALAWHGHSVAGVAPRVTRAERKVAALVAANIPPEDQRVHEMLKKMKARAKKDRRRRERATEPS